MGFCSALEKKLGCDPLQEVLCFFWLRWSSQVPQSLVHLAALSETAGPQQELGEWGHTRGSFENGGVVLTVPVIRSQLALSGQDRDVGRLWHEDFPAAPLQVDSCGQCPGPGVGRTRPHTHTHTQSSLHGLFRGCHSDVN